MEKYKEAKDDVLQANFNIDFPHLKCEYAKITATNFMGTHMAGMALRVNKVHLDSSGKAIAKHEERKTPLKHSTDEVKILLFISSYSFQSFSRFPLFPFSLFFFPSFPFSLFPLSPPSLPPSLPPFLSLRLAPSLRQPIFVNRLIRETSDALYRGHDVEREHALLRKIQTVCRRLTPIDSSLTSRCTRVPSRPRA